MLGIDRPDVGQVTEPTKVEDGPALVEDFVHDSDHTRYRAIVVSVSDNESFVLVEPAVEFGIAGPRRWFAVVRGSGPLSQDYVGEKLGFRDWRSVDCRNVTLLVASALGRPALLVGPDGYEEAVG